MFSYNGYANAMSDSFFYMCGVMVSCICIVYSLLFTLLVTMTLGISDRPFHTTVNDNGRKRVRVSKT